MLFDAIDFAVRAHRGQRRRLSSLPYIYHPMAVARRLMELGCMEEVVTAALLHDVVEDTPVTMAEVEGQFGPQVASLVAGVTEPHKSEPWEVRKQHTLAHLRTAPPGVLLILCADKLDNLSSMVAVMEADGPALWDHFNRPFPFQRWYYHAMVATLQARATDEPLLGLVAELAALVHALFGPAPEPNHLPGQEGESL